MVTGEVIHAAATANYTSYDYHAILIPNGVVATINGVALPSMASPITIPVGISNSTLISGSVFLIGRKKFGATSGTTGAWENPLSNDPGNSAGTFSIK
jgi:hypothetical protein